MANEALDQMWNILKENDFQIDPAIKSKIICISCKRVLIKPRIVPCGCRYCYDCLIRYLNEEDKFCLGGLDDCKSELINIDKNVFIDQPSNIKISKIVVKCPVESCEFESELKKMSDHLRTCDKQPVLCPYSAIGCEKKKIDFEKEKLHFNEENYSHSKLLMDFLDNLKNDVKLLKSNMLTLQDENKCIREEMESKKQRLEIFNANRVWGCCTVPTRILLLSLFVILFYNSTIIGSSTDEQMRTRIERIAAENILLREELEILKLDNKTKEKKEQEISLENWKLLEREQEQLKTRMDKMSEENDSMVKNSKKRKNEIKILETKLALVQVNENFQYVWCIDNWDVKRERAQNKIEKHILSDPFCSHRNGYKMRLMLYPDGLASYTGTHLSLYICILRGEFDNILAWPFLTTIKLDLINQQTNQPQVTKILDSKNNLSYWEKPDKEQKLADGFPDFLKLSELDLNTALFKGNKILIKVTVRMNL